MEKEVELDTTLIEEVEEKEMVGWVDFGLVKSITLFA